MSQVGNGRGRRMGWAIFAGVLLALCIPAGAASAKADVAYQRADPAPKSERVQGRIVGGSRIPIASAPWQVLVTLALPNGSEEFCGGAVLNATTVVTAAHCVTNSLVPPNLDVAPADITVDAGISGFDPSTGGSAPQPGDFEQTVGVVTNRVHPGYPRRLLNGAGTLADFVDDVAVLTLDTPLDLSQPAVKPIALTGENVLTAVGSSGTVTGYGLQSESPPALDGNLYQLGEAIQDGATTPAGPLNALVVAGVAPAGSFCSGDSGSAFQTGGLLQGIVSSNVSCANAQPNYYTNVAAGEIRQFILGNNTPPLAPRGGQDVTLRGPAGAPTEGDQLTCSPGTWTNAPTYTYVFSDTSTNTELQRGPSSTYQVNGVSDLGATISCRAQAANAGGVGLTPATAGPPAVVAKPPPPPPPPTSAPAKPGEPTAGAARYRLSLSLAASVARADSPASSRKRISAVRVRRAQQIKFTLAVRNKGNRSQTQIRRCVKLSSGMTLIRRGAGKVSAGRICFSSGSIRRGRLVRRTFTVRVDRDARLGRLAVLATARSRQGARASTRRSLYVRRQATPTPPRQPGVTG